MRYDQRSVAMGGLIAEKRMKATKNGSMMAFVQLEDLYGVTEVLVFPKVYDRVSQMLKTDDPVLMSGKLSIREDEAPKLLLDRIAPLRGSDAQENPNEPAAPRQNARRPAERKLYLKLHQDQRDQVLSILSETPGRIPVVLYIIEEKKGYLAPDQYRVDESYDFGALANLIGADGIVLK